MATVGAVWKLCITTCCREHYKHMKVSPSSCFSAILNSVSVLVNLKYMSEKAALAAVGNEKY